MSNTNVSGTVQHRFASHPLLPPPPPFTELGGNTAMLDCTPARQMQRRGGGEAPSSSAARGTSYSAHKSSVGYASDSRDQQQQRFSDYRYASTSLVRKNEGRGGERAPQGTGRSRSRCDRGRMALGASPDDGRRFSQRAKQVSYGLVTDGYKNMMRLVKHDPLLQSGGILPLSAPDQARGSKRMWDIQLRKWRRALHMFDYVFIDGEDPEEQRVIALQLQRVQWISAAFIDEATDRLEAQGKKNYSRDAEKNVGAATEKLETAAPIQLLRQRVKIPLDRLLKVRHSPLVPIKIPVEEDIKCILRGEHCYESVRNIIPHTASSITKGTDISPLEAGIKIHIAPSDAVLRQQYEQHRKQLEASCAASAAAHAKSPPAALASPSPSMPRRIADVSVLPLGSMRSPSPTQRLNFASMSMFNPSVPTTMTATAATTAAIGEGVVVDCALFATPGPTLRERSIDAARQDTKAALLYSPAPRAPGPPQFALSQTPQTHRIGQQGQSQWRRQPEGQQHQRFVDPRMWSGSDSVAVHAATMQAGAMNQGQPPLMMMPFFASAPDGTYIPGAMPPPPPHVFYPGMPPSMPYMPRPSAATASNGMVPGPPMGMFPIHDPAAAAAIGGMAYNMPPPPLQHYAYQQQQQQQHFYAGGGDATPGAHVYPVMPAGVTSPPTTVPAQTQGKPKHHTTADSESPQRYVCMLRSTGKEKTIGGIFSQQKNEEGGEQTKARAAKAKSREASTQTTEVATPGKQQRQQEKDESIARTVDTIASPAEDKNFSATAMDDTTPTGEKPQRVLFRDE